MKKTSQWTVWTCALAFACAAGGEVIRVGDGGGNPDYVQGTWPAGSVVEVAGPVVVGNGTSLTIGEGTVVNAEQGASLYVQDGATLTVAGTAEAPVRFTAASTYSEMGEDTGSGTWEGVSVAGTADFVHTELLYGGTESQGLLTVQSGGVARMDRSLVAHSTGAGIWNAGELWVTNTAVYDTAIAGVYLDASGGQGVSRAQFTHCVIDRGELGIYEGGGDGVFANCDISDYRTYGAAYVDGIVSFNRCNFHSERGIMVTEGPLEAVRRLEVPPRFADPENHDFRLTQESELIDAGDAVEGATEDAFGNGRANAAHVEPTGTADANGKYPDIGLHEWQPTYTEQDVDIFVQDIHVEPTEAKTGDPLTVTWTLVNAGHDPFSGTWRDALKLVPSRGAEVELGESERTGTIPGGEELECTATFVVPAVADRTWEVKVVVDADGGVPEKLGAEMSNENVSIEKLTTRADVWDVAGALNVEVPAGAERVYAVTGLDAAGRSLKVSGTGTDWTVAGAYHGLPTAAYSWKSTRAADGAVWLWAPGAAEGTEAYLVLGNEGVGRADLLLQGGGTGMQIFTTDRAEVTTSTNTSVTADGIGLEGGVTAILQKEGAEERYEAALGGSGAVRRHAIFDIHEASAGAYRFGISDGEATAWLEEPITVRVAETGAVLRTTTMMPVQFHAGIPHEGFVHYVNEGDADMWLPEFVVRAGNAGDTMLSTSPEGPFDSTSLYLNGWSPTEPAVVLKAGESGKVSFYYQAVQGVDIHVAAGGERSEAEYRRMQAELDEQQTEADALAEQDAASENTGYPTGNEEPMDGRIEGHLLMSVSEEPVEGVELVLLGASGQSSATGLMEWQELARTTTGADGSFVFEDLPVAGSFLFDSGEVELETTESVRFADMDNPLLQDCVVSVAAMYHRLGGRVTGDGTPLAGVTVSLKSDAGWDETETDADGRWGFQGLQEGGYEVQAQASQGFARSAKEEVSLQEDTELTLELTRGGVVHATATDAATGGPIAGLWVIAYDATTETPCDRAVSDENGHLEFPGLPPGAYRFLPENGRWEQANGAEPVMVAADSDQDVELEFSETCFFEAWPYFGAYPLRVMIDYYDEDRIPAGVDKWEWDFDGDGVIDCTGRNPRFWYETNGVFDIVLKASMADGTTNEYRLSNAVEVVEPLETALRDTVVILAETNTDYAYVSSVAGETNQQLVLRQLVDEPSQSIGQETVFVIAVESHVGPPIVKVVTAEKDGDTWQIVTEEVTDIRAVFSSIQMVPTGDTLPSEEDDGPSPQHRATPKASGDVGNVWKSKDGLASVTATYDTGEGVFYHVLRYSEAMNGIHFELMWKRNFDFGLHFLVDSNATGRAHWENTFLDKEVKVPIADCGIVGVWFTANIRAVVKLDFSWKKGTSIDSHPQFKWQPRIRLARNPAFGAAEGGWHISTPDAPKLGFGENKWDLSGDMTASASVRAEAKVAFQARALKGSVALLDIMNGKAWAEAAAGINANIASRSFDFGWTTDYGVEVNFLSFENTILDDLFGVTWTAWKCPLTGNHKTPWPSLSWPFGGANGSFSWPKPLMPDFNVSLGSLFGGVPKFSWPGFPPNFSGWKPPTFPNFKWSCGVWPPRFPTYEFSEQKDWSSWTFDLGSLSFPGLNLGGLNLKGIIGKAPDLKLEFARLGINFHLPTVSADKFDFDAPVICLPQFTLPFEPKLGGFTVRNLKGKIPDWMGLGEGWLNLPAELYLDWGDGTVDTVDMSSAEMWNVSATLSRLLRHEYPGPGIYQGEVGVRLRYVNALNKNLKFTVVVLNQDLDEDGMPNMWEALYPGTAEKPGLNPLVKDADGDADGDGLTNLQEFLAGTHPLKEDVDNDKMPDSFEVMYMVPPEGESYTGLKPWHDDGHGNADRDGMENVDEYQYKSKAEGGGNDYGPDNDDYASTNPMNPDTDGGGMRDGDEYKFKDDPEKVMDLFDPSDDTCKCGKDAECCGGKCGKDCKCCDCGEGAECCNSDCKECECKKDCGCGGEGGCEECGDNCTCESKDCGCGGAGGCEECGDNCTCKGKDCGCGGAGGCEECGDNCTCKGKDCGCGGAGGCEECGDNCTCESKECECVNGGKCTCEGECTCKKPCKCGNGGDCNGGGCEDCTCENHGCSCGPGGDCGTLDCPDCTCDNHGCDCGDGGGECGTGDCPDCKCKKACKCGWDAECCYGVCGDDCKCCDCEDGPCGDGNCGNDCRCCYCEDGPCGDNNCGDDCRCCYCDPEDECCENDCGNDCKCCDCDPEDECCENDCGNDCKCCDCDPEDECCDNDCENDCKCCGCDPEDECCENDCGNDCKCCDCDPDEAFCGGNCGEDCPCCGCDPADGDCDGKCEDCDCDVCQCGRNAKCHGECGKKCECKKCKDWTQIQFKYCAVCNDGFIQWALSHIMFGFWTDCPQELTTIGKVVAWLTGYSEGSSGGVGGGSGNSYGSYGGGAGAGGCGKVKRPPDHGDPIPDGNSNSHKQKSAVFLPMGDYTDEALDLPVRAGGTTAGLARQLQDNEWTFREAASGLELAPGMGTEDEVSVGTGSLGVEWNASGAPGAAPALTNTATGAILKSVPTGLWGAWEGTTQALIRVEYGILRGNGTVATNYGELVKAWRAALEGGNTGKAAELESAAMEGVVRVTAAEDAEGRRTEYEWNGAGQMTVAHFADGTQESYEYGAGGLMSGKTKRDGEHVGLVHDNYGYLTGLNDYKYEYTYDAGTKTFYAAIRYPDGRVGERWFDEDGRIFRYAMNGGLVWDREAVKADALLAAKPAWPKEVLNDAELPVSVEYRSGAAEAFAWDGPGYARTGATEATGEELSWTYDDAGREMSETRGGVARSVERDDAGYVTREQLDSASGTEEAEWAWDAAGNASEGRMGGWARTNTYDLAGRVLTAAGADGGTWAFDRDEEGRVTAWTQPDGESGAKTYDGRGRMTWRRSPGGVETWWSHATNGLLTGWSNSLGRKAVYQYDLGERVAKATDEAGGLTTYAYDGAGNWRGVAPELRTFVNDGEGGLVLAVTNGGRVTTAHRLWGTWLLRDVQANDQSWRLERNEEGQVTGLVRAPTEGTAATNRWTYDAAGRLSGWTDATGVSASRGYDGAGFVAWETNGAGGVRRWTHDGTGRLTGVTDAAGRSSVFAYAPATGTTTATLADGSQIELRTDAWGREIGRTDAAGTEIATERRFDGAVLRKAWTAVGAESAALEATWTRDGDGQLLAQGMTGGPATRFERTGSNRCERTVTEYGAFEAGVAVERDAEGRVTAVEGADGARAECVYGDDGEVSGWMLPEGSVWFARDLSDRKRTMQLPLGQRVTEWVDLSGWVTNVVLTDTDRTVAWSLSLARDAAGRIVGQGTETLEWDGAERVVSAGGTAYARDAAGNRSAGGWTTEGMDRLTAWPGGTYGYDANGAVVSRTSGASELRFARDLAGRVTEIRDGTDALVARFAYDAEGHRLSKETGAGAVTWYLWSGDRLAAELSGEGTVERVYGYWTEEARSPDWVRTGGELYVVLKDGFGAAAALVAVSDGAVTVATPGTVFGEGWACAAMPVWADGLLADAETGLMAGADGRLYDPATGRWLSPTPGAVAAGLNRYAREPSSTGAGREFPGLSMPGVAPEYDVVYAFARRCGADAATAASLARAELLLGLEGRSDAAARRWVRLRDEATAAAGLRLLGGVPASQVVCARTGVESFLKARRDVLAVTDELDAYGKLRSAMDLEEAFRLELAWSGTAEDRAAMGAWRGTWGWAGLRPEGPSATERWLALLQQAANGERLSEETLEWLGEAKLLALSDWVRPVTASLDAEKMRETVGADMTELRQVLQMWVKECK